MSIMTPNQIPALEDAGTVERLFDQEAARISRATTAAISRVPRDAWERVARHTRATATSFAELQLTAEFHELAVA